MSVKSGETTDVVARSEIPADAMRTESVVNGDAAVPAIEIVNATHKYPGGALPTMIDVDFAAAVGEFVAVVGPSGCGKSTLLTMIAGLSKPVSGSVRVLGDAVSGVRRDVGFILQRDSLLPWRTALANVELPLRLRGMSRAEARERARAELAMVGLEGMEHRYPAQLSGGQRKRVAIAATMVYEPRILLMDEPFSALDAQTRNLIEEDILSLWEQAGDQTVVFVTHDLDEAIALSDRVVLVSAGPGRIVSDYRVELPRPRDLVEVRFETEFRELEQRIWADLSKEVSRGNRRGKEA